MSRAAVWGIVLLVPLSLALSVSLGSVSFSGEEWHAFFGGDADPSMREILFELRAPRAMAAFGCGALLAVAGALLQVLLRNPLADPYLLGVSGGASVGALSGMLLGLSLWAIHGLAFIGGAAAALVLVLFAASLSGWQIHRVLLVGVAIAAGCGAVVALILSIAPSAQLQGMLFWLMGDLSSAIEVWPLWIVLLLVLVLGRLLAAPLDALSLGERKAASLGVAVRRTQLLAFAAATAASVAVVMTAGAIGFIGLVVPHLLRLAGIHHHDRLLPLSALAGGGLLTFADTAARTVAAPVEFPVGVMTAMIGVPVLLVLLVKAR
jgi:iron complex transport system permease protein